MAALPLGTVQGFMPIFYLVLLCGPTLMIFASACIILYPLVRQGQALLRVHGPSPASHLTTHFPWLKDGVNINNPARLS